MPTDQSTSQRPPMTATTTVTAVTTFASASSSELPPSVAKWGDPISSIPAERQAELTNIAEAQQAWVTTTGADRDPKQSPFAKATDVNHPLTGAEVFFLTASSLAGSNGDVEQQAAKLRLTKVDDPNTWKLPTELHLEGAVLLAAHLEGAYLYHAHLEGSNFYYAHLESADLVEAHLEGANLHYVHLEGADLYAAHLEGANLRRAFLSSATRLGNAFIADTKLGPARLVDVRWQEVNLAVITQWSKVKMLGDEQEARKLANEPLAKGASRADREKRHNELLTTWRDAARANRQLASVMRDQGMNDEADRFAYRGNICQRRVLRAQGIKKLPSLLGSALLAALSGYGYRIGRIFAAYILLITLFAAIYLVLGIPHEPPTTTQGHVFNVLLVSLTAIHGRVFFEQFNFSLQGWVAAIESAVGIVLEGVFVAMLIQRWFQR